VEGYEDGKIIYNLKIESRMASTNLMERSRHNLALMERKFLDGLYE
jgi:hypothetical protein